MKIKISAIKENIKNMLLRSPVELFVSVCYFVVSVLNYERLLSNSEIGVIYPLIIIAVYSINRLTYGTKFRLLYYISALSVSLGLLEFGIDEKILVAYVCAVLLMFFSHRTASNKRFVDRNFFMAESVVFAGIMAGLVYLVYYSIVLFTTEIFDLSWNEWKISRYVFIFVYSVVWPFIFLVLDRDDVRLKGDRVLKVAVNYILSPAFLIYAVLLYMYFAKILFSWELPRGTVSTVSLIFLFVGIVLYSMQYLLEKKYFKWLYDYLPLWVIPAVLMAWVAAVYRIMEYGFTDSRVYLLYTTIIATVFYVAFMFGRTDKLRWLTVFAFVLLMTTFIPGITPDDIERRSQSRYRERVLTMEDDDVEKVYYATGPNRESIYIHLGDTGKKIDVSNYSRLYVVDSYYYKSDDNIWYDNDEGMLYIFQGKNDTLFSISHEEMFDRIFRNAGFSRHVNETPPNMIEDNKEKFLEYSDDSVKIILSYANYSYIEGEFGKYKADIPSLKYFLTK